MTVVTVTSLVEEGVLIDTGWPVESLEGVLYSLVSEEGVKSGGLDQEEDDTLREGREEEREREGEGEERDGGGEKGRMEEGERRKRERGEKEERERGRREREGGGRRERGGERREEGRRGRRERRRERCTDVHVII